MKPPEPPTMNPKRPAALAEAQGSASLPQGPLELQRLINSLPPDVNKKLSLHDLKRICDNYNTGACPNCYGGHFRPCQWCGDTGIVTMMPKLNNQAEP